MKSIWYSQETFEDSGEYANISSLRCVQEMWVWTWEDKAEPRRLVRGPPESSPQRWARVPAVAAIPVNDYFLILTQLPDR